MTLWCGVSLLWFCFVCIFIWNLETLAAHNWVNGKKSMHFFFFFNWNSSNGIRMVHTHTHVRTHGAQLHSTLISLLCVAIFISFYLVLLVIVVVSCVHIVQCITTAKWAHTFTWLLIYRKKNTLYCLLFAIIDAIAKKKKKCERQIQHQRRKKHETCLNCNRASWFASD